MIFSYLDHIHSLYYSFLSLVLLLTWFSKEPKQIEACETGQAQLIWVGSCHASKLSRQLRPKSLTHSWPHGASGVKWSGVLLALTACRTHAHILVIITCMEAFMNEAQSWCANPTFPPERPGQARGSVEGRCLAFVRDKEEGSGQ
jgi:hypothetical protein